ncbi:MAG: flagellar basal body rod protein FlgC [Rickettsia sp.]|nr:flagellar basal body rod protein FlgC [Rickettsia sp.]
MFRKTTFLFLAFSFSDVFADNIKQSIQILNNANLIQMKRIKIATENLVNVNSFYANKTPYRRKIITVENRYDKKHKSTLLHYQIKHSNWGFNVKYDPFHPFANQMGYVKFSNVVTEIEKADLMEAHRGYEANLATIEMSNSLINKTLEVIK